MKSPLVDALRQASNESPPEGAEGKVQEADLRPASENTEAPGAPSMELDLLETGRYEATSGIVTEDAPAAGVDAGIDESIPDQGPAFAESTTPDALDAPAPASKLPDPGGASIHDHKGVTARIGQLSPLLCVFALAVSAGAYLVLNDLSITDFSKNFTEYSASVELPGSQQINDADAVKLPMTGVSVFEQLHASPVVKPTAVEHAPQSTGMEVTVLPEPVPVPEEARDVVPASSRNNTKNVEDAAYASVVAAYEAYRRDDLVEAEELYTAALGIEPNHRDGLAGLAAIYLQTGRTDQAVAAYEKLLGLEPQNTAAAAAILAIRSDDIDWEIESELKLLLQRFPDSHHLHNALGSIYVGLERWPDAKHEFLIAHKLAPGNADYSYNTAVSLDRMGQLSAAQDYYRLALNSANEHSGFDRSAILAHLDEFEQQRRERL